MSKSIRRRRTVARHGQLRSPGAIGQFFKILGVSAAVVAVSAVSVGTFVVSDLYTTASADAVVIDGQEDAPPNISEYEGGFDILLTGVDTCEEKYADLFGERCEGPDAGGTLNDVNLLVHVSEEPRRITAVSFPRDLMLPIPECERPDGSTISAMSKQQLNSSYGEGGLNCVVRTISELTGQDIEFAASVTFGGVIEITNSIGGVEVCLANPIKDEHTGLDMQAGTHIIQGLQALQFLRTRHGVGDGSDLGRIGNQQQYMSSLARRLISDDVLGNIPVMLRLANVTLSNIEPSSNLTNPMTLVQVALAVKDVPFEDIVFVQYPTFGDPDDPNRVVPNYEAAQALWDAVNANMVLEITHENTENDGVIVEPDPNAVEPDPNAVPDPNVVALPDSIKGNSAAQQTCSNGNVR